MTLPIGLTPTQFERLKKVVKAFETQGNPSTEIKREMPRYPIESYLGLVNEEVTPFASGTVGAGTATVYRLEIAEDDTITLEDQELDIPVYNLGKSIPVDTWVILNREAISGQYIAATANTSGGFWARITDVDDSGSRTKYSWVESELFSNGSTGTLSGGRSGTVDNYPAFEINNNTVEKGVNVWLTPGNANYFFSFECPCVLCSCDDTCSLCPEGMATKWEFDATGFTGQMTGFNGHWILSHTVDCIFSVQVGTITVEMKYDAFLGGEEFGWQIHFTDSSNGASANYTFDNGGACPELITGLGCCPEGIPSVLHATITDESIDDRYPCFDGVEVTLNYAGDGAWVGWGDMDCQGCRVRITALPCTVDCEPTSEVGGIIIVETFDCGGDSHGVRCCFMSQNFNCTTASCSPFYAEGGNDVYIEPDCEKRCNNGNDNSVSDTTNIGCCINVVITE